jgi:hypothetical protein
VSARSLPQSHTARVNALDEKSRSLWMDPVVAQAPPLKDNITADTVVIGSGIVGLSTAYELACLGQKVVVIDRGQIAGGMSARTSAHLTPQCDDGFKTLNKLRGVEGGKIFYNSHAAAVDRIEEIQKEEEINCRFRRVNGYLFPAIGKDPAEEITPEFEATKEVGCRSSDTSDCHSREWRRPDAFATPISQPSTRCNICEVLRTPSNRVEDFFNSQTAVTEITETDGTVTVQTANNARVEAAHAGGRHQFSHQ